MLMIRLGIVVLLLTVVTWALLKYYKKPMHFGLVFLFWVASFLIIGGIFFGISTMVANSNNF